MLDSLPPAFWPIIAFLVLVLVVVIVASRGRKSSRQNSGSGDGGAYPHAPGTASDGDCGGDGGGD